MHSATSSLSFDEEFTRLKEDLAVERAERHALASRVEALLRLQQKTGSRRSGSPPSLPTATSPEGTPTPPTADPSIANGSQAAHSGQKPVVAGIQGNSFHEHTPPLASGISPSHEADNISGGASAARLLHGREWSSGLDVACSARQSGVDVISVALHAGDGNLQLDSGATTLHVSKGQDLPDPQSRQGRDYERPTEPMQRVAEKLSSSGGSGKPGEGNAVQDAMLADARAILAELEQDLAGSGPANSKPDVAASSASEELLRPLLPDTADVPHVLSFYRRKCLELATQVQKRDTEVVNLRRALNEARSMGGGCG